MLVMEFSSVAKLLKDDVIQYIHNLQ